MREDLHDLFFENDRSREFWELEHLDEREHRLMRSFYPDTARMIYPRVAEECDRLDYPGSFFYDEYPDKRMIELACRRIRRALTETGNCDERLLNELIRVLFGQEMLRRRRRGMHCRRCIF